MPPNPQNANPKPPSKPLPTASPSASILLISPTNHILLLRRVQKSSSFASAHVFPGGHIDPSDGFLPPQGDVRRHEDSMAYRVGAIRECFEESGILLARKLEGDLFSSSLLRLDEGERDAGRRAVHDKAVDFHTWVRDKGGVPDVEGLCPFTRWLTPADIPKRFSTQMYLYFLPLALPGLPRMLHVPTSDGGVEHTEAQFLPAAEWLELARAEKIILFPPQFFLLKLVADFLDGDGSVGEEGAVLSGGNLQLQRDRLLEFVKTGDPPWGEKCISPSNLKQEGRRLALGLDYPGPELEATSRRGENERVIWVQLKGKGGASALEVGWRRDVVEEGLNGEERREYLETRRIERERRGSEDGLERAIRGGKAHL
ncbi:MAG: hypothetical protein Q9182_000263 [Xanthomendoza sp. 2 TL-2023]